jgi:hypothetical protein
MNRLMKTRMTGLTTFKWITLAIFVIALGLVSANGQDKPGLVVHAFTIASGVSFPYDMNDLQTQTIGEIKQKNGDQFADVTDAQSNVARVYTLDGEVQEWHKGNTAERMLIAAGTVAGRENAKVHFWLTDKDGKKVYEQTDVVRQLFMRNKHEKSTGMLARPFREKISERLKDAKVS